MRASGGGYDGRSADVVVNVGDDDGSGWDVEDEAGALRLLQAPDSGGPGQGVPGARLLQTTPLY